MFKSVKRAIAVLCKTSEQEGRNLQMASNQRYQPKGLKPYLGYDQWAGWLIIVEWFWMKTLAKIHVMPKEDADLLTEELLSELLSRITTTLQDAKEKEQGQPWSNHDMLALLALMREHLPKQLHRWLHYCATSYDIICTAYALQIKATYEQVFMPELRELDKLWREKITKNANVPQSFRTHLQTALPGTIGCWLANLHNRFVGVSRKALGLSSEVPGKFSGAVGTSASQRALIKVRKGEEILMIMLGLPKAEISTQIAPPEGMARLYYELVLLSGVLANLGEDVRLLQSSQFGEITSLSSTSSAMSHKRENPIAAEQLKGMHSIVIAENSKVTMNLVSDLQRDLCGSSPMRDYQAVAVYTFQQILTAKRLMKSMVINVKKCQENFDREKYLVVAELLHLFLQSRGVPDAHHLVNKILVPIAMKTGKDLYTVVHDYEHGGEFEDEIGLVWDIIGEKDNEEADGVVRYLQYPEEYIGDAVQIAQREAENKL